MNGFFALKSRDPIFREKIKFIIYSPSPSPRLPTAEEVNECACERKGKRNFKVKIKF